MKNIETRTIVVALVIIIGIIWIIVKPNNVDGPIITEVENQETQEVSKESTIVENNGKENAGWNTYTNVEWKYSFEYPNDYTLTEDPTGYKVKITPTEGYPAGEEFFAVTVIQYPEVEEKSMIPGSLFYVANFPNGKIAWFKDNRVFDYEANTLIEMSDVTFGLTNTPSIEVRETSINPERGEYRSLVYVLRDPAIYRVINDLSAEESHGEILQKIKASFTVIE